MGWTHGDRTQMPRKKETTIRHEPAPDPDTAEQLMVAAWPYCGVIQDIIDRLNATGSNTELRLLANRLSAWSSEPRQSCRKVSREILAPRRAVLSECWRVGFAVNRLRGPRHNPPRSRQFYYEKMFSVFVPKTKLEFDWNHWPILFAPARHCSASAYFSRVTARARRDS
jgi:hypothetical protein